MKKVLFICSVYKPNVGGVETAIDELAKFYVEQGLQVTILTKRFPFNLPDYEEIDHIPVVRIDRPKTFKDYAKTWRALAAYKDVITSDIIHVMGVRRPMTYIALMLGKLWKVPVIINFSGGDIFDKNDAESMRIWEEGKDITPQSIQQADFYIAFSKDIAEQAHACIPDLPDIAVVYAGIYTKNIKYVRRFEALRPYLLSVRRLYYAKGLDILISAFARVQKKHPKFDLYIVGDGPEMDNLKKQTQALGLEDEVKFMGTQPLETVYALMKGSVAHICPSRSEGGGTVNIEAQAAGTIAIGSTAGGIPEYIADNETGLLFQSEDVFDLTKKLLAIIEDETLRERLVQTALHRIDTFDWNHVARQYLDMYTKARATYNNRSLVPWKDNVIENWQELQDIWM